MTHDHATTKKEGDKVPQVLPLWFVAELYELTITPTLKAPFRFEGESTLHAEILQENEKVLTLHARELFIETATWLPQGATAAIEAKKISFDLGEHEVAFDFGEALPKGKGKLFTKFIGTHNNQMAGFYRSMYNNAEGKPQVMVSTQFEALDARRCFPCIDEPAAKAVFKAVLIVDENLTALSNCPEAEVTVLPLKDGELVRKKKVTFLETPKMSTYLLAFAVGEFDFIQARTKHGVLVRIFTPPAKAHLGTFALHVATESLDLYDNFFKVPYPLAKLDMIAIPEFAMGAMENWGLVTYREVEILVAEDASADQRQRVCTVITHELAHQWFGNLVTMNWWTGLWLNEGFASWMQTFAADVIFPKWEIWSQFVVDDQATALSLDALASSHPIEVPIGKAEEVEEVFDAISYHKGACVVQLAFAYLGEESFKQGLQLYMKKHAYGNTSTMDLWRAWEDASGKPVADVMKTWTLQMGFPILKLDKIEMASDKIVVSGKQSWFLSDGSAPSEQKTWKIPLIGSYSTGEKEDDVMVSNVNIGLMSEEAGRFTVDVKGLSASPKAWVKMNSGQNVPMRVLYHPEDLARLVAAVKKQELKSSDRAGLLLEQYALCKAGLLEPGALLQLLGAYENETNMAVWDAVEQVLGAFANLLKSDAAVEALFAKFATKLITKYATALGWDAKAEDDHLATLSRAILVRLQSKFSAQSCKDLAIARYEEFVKSPLKNNVPADIRVPAFRVALSVMGGSEQLEEMFKVLKQLETIAQMKDIYASVGFIKSVEDKTRVLDWCTSGAIKLQDFFYPIASVSASSNEGAELCFQYMKTHFQRMHSMVKTASPSLIMAVISYCCSGFSTLERAQEIEDFFKANPVPLAARKVSQIVENTRANANFLNRIKASKMFMDVLKA